MWIITVWLIIVWIIMAIGKDVVFIGCVLRGFFIGPFERAVS